jgi:hypothetical protein
MIPSNNPKYARSLLVWVTTAPYAHWRTGCVRIVKLDGIIFNSVQPLDNLAAVFYSLLIDLFILKCIDIVVSEMYCKRIISIVKWFT